MAAEVAAICVETCCAFRVSIALILVSDVSDRCVAVNDRRVAMVHRRVAVGRVLREGSNRGKRQCARNEED